jgi:hypothetical protein
MGKSTGVKKIKVKPNNEIVDNSPVRRTIKVPDPKNANDVLFPFPKRAGGGDKEVKAKSFALMAAWREYLCNFHSFRRFEKREENKAVIGTMKIGDDCFVFGFHNGKPFTDRKAITQNGLVTNESSNNGGGISLQGAGLKLPAQYLTFPGTQQLIVASKCGEDGKLIAGVATNNTNLFDINIVSDEETDKNWKNILKKRCGASFDEFTVFYLAKISPFFNPDSGDCVMAGLWPILFFMCGDLLQDIDVHVVETCLPENLNLKAAMLQPNYGFKLFSKKEMLEAYCCKDDDGKATVDESVFVSELKKIVFESNGIKAEMGVRVRLYPMAGKFAAETIEHILDSARANLAYKATLRNVPRSAIGSGSRPGKITAVRAGLKISSVYKHRASETCYKRFNDQPIALMRKGEVAMLYSALGLPVTDEFKPTMIGKDGTKKVIRQPWLLVEVDVETMDSCLDTVTGQTTSDPVLLALKLGLRGDFLIPHAEPKFKEMRDELMIAACEAVGKDITQDHWIYKWCEERFAPVEHQLYDRNKSFSEAGEAKEKRKILKFDIENYAHDFKLSLCSDVKKFVAFKLADTGSFISAEVDSDTHSAGCTIQRLPIPFTNYMNEWLEEQNEQTSHLSSGLRKKMRQENLLKKENILKSYELFKNKENHGNDVTIYLVSVDQIGFRDDKYILHPFAEMDRDLF